MAQPHHSPAELVLRRLRRVGSIALAPLRRRRYARIYASGRLVDGNLPVIYISQLWRSGGTMLSQLFDNVPGVLAFPKELKFGVGKTDPLCLDEMCAWPVDEVRKAFMRANGAFGDALRGRYHKASGESLPFQYDVGLFCYLFERLWKDNPPRCGRDLAGTFFTAFFSAWLDRRSSAEPARYVTGFASFTALQPGNVDRYFGYYPDGYLIQIIREPVAWYRSVKAKPRKRAGSPSRGRNIDEALEMYRRQGLSLADNLRRYPGRCILLDYDDLVSDPASHMAFLCAEFGLEYSEIASRATFNGFPIGANTSFRNSSVPESILSPSEIALVEREAGPTYKEARQLVSAQPIRPPTGRAPD
jgi:hypothetical protein